MDAARMHVRVPWPYGCSKNACQSPIAQWMQQECMSESHGPMDTAKMHVRVLWAYGCSKNARQSLMALWMQQKRMSESLWSHRWGEKLTPDTGWKRDLMGLNAAEMKVPITTSLHPKKWKFWIHRLQVVYLFILFSISAISFPSILIFWNWNWNKISKTHSTHQNVDFVQKVWAREDLALSRQILTDPTMKYIRDYNKSI